MSLIVSYRFPQVFNLQVALAILRDEYDKMKQGDTNRAEIQIAIQDLTQQLGFQQALGIGISTD